MTCCWDIHNRTAMSPKQIVSILLSVVLLASFVYLQLYNQSVDQKLVNKARWLIRHSIFLKDIDLQNQSTEHSEIKDKPTTSSNSEDVSKSTTSITPSMCPQEKRRQIFHDACFKHGKPVESYGKLSGGLIVDDRHKLVYCGAAKGGSTAWLNILIKASGKDTANRRLVVHSQKVQKTFGLNHIMSYNKTQIKYILDNYFKFIVVRHPIERVVSAWNDKFIRPDGPYKKLGKRIAEKYRRFRNTQQNNTNSQGYWDSRALFVEFARHLASTHQKNSHWNNYGTACNPCAVNWDAIVKIETTQDDSTQTIFPRLGDDISATALPILHSHSQRNSLNHFEKELPDMAYILPDTLKYLMSIYQEDMDMFGYYWNQTSLIASCGTQNTCC